MAAVYSSFAAVFLAFVLVGHSNGEATSKKAISTSASFAYGPGIDQRRTQLPVSYLYVQAVRAGAKGSNYTGLLGEDELKIEFLDSAGKRVAARTELYNLDKGLSLCRYRVYREAEGVTLSVKLHNKHVKSSPFKIRAVQSEDCHCPHRSVDQWLADFQCPSTHKQVESDLTQFQAGGILLNGLYERTAERFPRTSFVHYSIIRNKVYARTFGDIVGFKSMSDMVLLSLTNKIQLPDVELIVNLADWPLDKISSSSPLPILSWCGSKASRDIIWPTYDIMRGTIQGMDRVSLDMLSSQQSKKIPWKQRKPIAFFRGRDSNQARLDLVRLFRNRTDRFDVAITNFFFFQHDEQLYGPTKDRISFHDFFKYKYQINIDGTVAAYRLPYLLAGGSLVLKQDSEYYEHFYHLLEPWVHYVPVKSDISDLDEKLQWAMDNDKKAKQIADNAFQFVVDNLLPDKLYCYLVTLFKEYARLQKGTPQMYPNMEEVKPEGPKGSTCHTCPLHMLEKQEKEEL